MRKDSEEQDAVVIDSHKSSRRKLGRGTMPSTASINLRRSGDPSQKDCTAIEMKVGLGYE
jgi:hypothetical protein